MADIVSVEVQVTRDVDCPPEFPSVETTEVA